MFVIDSSRPKTRQRMFERLWLPNSTKAISLNILDEGRYLTGRGLLLRIVAMLTKMVRVEPAPGVCVVKSAAGIFEPEPVTEPEPEPDSLC